MSMSRVEERRTNCGVDWKTRAREKCNHNNKKATCGKMKTRKEKQRITSARIGWWVTARIAFLSPGGSAYLPPTFFLIRWNKTPIVGWFFSFLGLSFEFVCLSLSSLFSSPLKILPIISKWMFLSLLYQSPFSHMTVSELFTLLGNNGRGDFIQDLHSLKYVRLLLRRFGSSWWKSRYSNRTYRAHISRY